MTRPSAPRAVVTSVGAVCPVGLDALSAAAALRAGVSRLTDAPEVTVAAGPHGLTVEPAVAARVPGIRARGAERDAALLGPALAEALRRARAPVDRALVTVGSAARDPAGALVRAAVGPGAEVVVEAGRWEQAGALDALVRAAAAVRAGDAERVLVAGAGSLAEPGALRDLARRGRLKSAFVPDGAVPGEAAAALVVESEAGARARGAPALAIVLGSGAAHEAGTRAQGRALTEAVRGALGAADCDVGLVVADLNGDRERAREWSVAAMRALPFRHDERDLWHPAEGVGDAGAGAGALLLVVAALALARRHAPTDAVLVVASDDVGARRAVVLGAADPIRLVPGEPPLGWA